MAFEDNKPFGQFVTLFKGSICLKVSLCMGGETYYLKKKKKSNIENILVRTKTVSPIVQVENWHHCVYCSFCTIMFAHFYERVYNQRRKFHRIA